jgi:hypothetical protein
VLSILSVRTSSSRVQRQSEQHHVAPPQVLAGEWIQEDSDEESVAFMATKQLSLEGSGGLLLHSKRGNALTSTLL